MKAVTNFLIASTFTSIASFNAHAESTFYPEYLKDDMVNVCKAIKENKPKTIKQIVKNSGLTYKVLDQSLKCNGKHAIEFALDNKSEKAAVFLAEKTNTNYRDVIAKRAQ